MGERSWAAVVASRSTVEERCRAAWAEAGVPARFAAFRLEGSPLAADGGVVERLILPASPGSDAPEAWEQWEARWAESWYLWGPVGTGKTGLAVGYARQFADPSFGEPARVLFWSVPDLLEALRGSYAAVRRTSGMRSAVPDETTLLRECRTVDLLVLDDVGAEQPSGSGWVEDRLYQVIGGRHAEMRPVVFTSNWSVAELGERLGPRIAWRIVEMCGAGRIVKVEGRNLRDGG